MSRPFASLLLLAVAACTDRDPMTKQARDDAYRSEPFFKDSRAMRPTVADTISQEAYAEDALVRPLRTPDGGFKDQLPLALTKDLLEEGHQQYDVVCATCHGVLGDGDSPVAKKMQQRPPPALVGFGSGLRYPVGYYFAAMTYGYGVMPSYASQLTPRERWAIVGYLQALSLSSQPPLSMRSPSGGEP